MRLSVVNVSNQVGSADLEKALAAIQIQVDRDFFPEWNERATLIGKTRRIGDDDAPVDQGHDAILYVGDQTQDPTQGVDNVMGYHARNHGKVPYGFVYLDVCELNGRPWQLTLSHEVLETLADPNGLKTVKGPHPTRPGQSVRWYLEVCDPTQDDRYAIQGVEVSNFVTRAWFEPSDGTRATNHLGRPLAPFECLGGGYAAYVDPHGRQEQIHGALAPELLERRATAQRLMKLGRRIARRAQCIESSIAKEA